MGTTELVMNKLRPWPPVVKNEKGNNLFKIILTILSSFYFYQSIRINVLECLKLTLPTRYNKVKVFIIVWKLN